MLNNVVIHLIALENGKLQSHTNVSVWVKAKTSLIEVPKQEQKNMWKVPTLKGFFDLPLHSLQAPDVLYFALFFCRGKQLKERETERLVVKGKPASQLGFNSLKWLCVYSFNPLNCTFKPVCKSQRSLTVDGASVSVTVSVCARLTFDVFLYYNHPFIPLLTDHYVEASLSY